MVSPDAAQEAAQTGAEIESKRLHLAQEPAKSADATSLSRMIEPIFVLTGGRTLE